MPTTLQTKFLEDSQGNKYAPVTTPNAVRWPNGDDLDDKLPTTMGASGTNHKGGLVPDTPSTAGTSKYLREDGTWAEPSGGGSSVPANVALLENADNTAFSPDFDAETDTLHVTSQTLTASQKIQARTNIGITTSTSEPTANDGNDGDIWIVYED